MSTQPSLSPHQTAPPPHTHTPTANREPQAHIEVAQGDGPRHFVFHPTLPIAYSGCELKSQVQVRLRPPPGRAF
jgi:6-phosphogluconolactonase (cycloisomerase 2 family)